ncbi:MAG: hypothetical protein CM15mV10_1090 [uncultured marine virus]|nr:MAG: hypothetical protein CM15mV10_1090 [uncultured marine virus]
MIFMGGEIQTKKIEHCILPSNVKETFTSFVKQGEIPNLLLSGTAGVGKTTIAKALCNELGADFYVINGSDEGRFLDTYAIRQRPLLLLFLLHLNLVIKFSLLMKRTIRHPITITLTCLNRGVPENCRFIFTCNFKNKIIEPLHSRTTVIDFNVRGKTKQELASKFFERCRGFLLQKIYNTLILWSLKSSRNTSQTLEEHSTNYRDTHLQER